MNHVEVLRAEGRNGLRRFLSLPKQLYSGLPGWVAPLDWELRQRLDPRHNVMLRGRELALFLAVRDGKDVGRIAAHIDPFDDNCGCFGFLDAVDDSQVFGGLIDIASQWLAENGAERMEGPFNTTINEESGLLVENFTDPPAVMMGYAPPYAGQRVEEAGLRKVVDLLAYSIDLTHSFAPWASRLLERSKRMGMGISVRPMNMSRHEDIAVMVDIFNDAWADNWGFRPSTVADGEELARRLRMLLRKDHALLGLVDDEPAGLLIAIPDLNEAITGFNGGLLPFNWALLPWRLRHVRRARIPLMGVRRKYHGAAAAAVVAALFGAIEETGRRFGYRRAEMSWVLENNKPVRSLLEAGGLKVNKRYRIFGKPL